MIFDKDVKNIKQKIGSVSLNEEITNQDLEIESDDSNQDDASDDSSAFSSTQHSEREMIDSKLTPPVKDRTKLFYFLIVYAKIKKYLINLI
jgi:hypothetical protein